jgi:hypothetical protein
MNRDAADEIVQRSGILSVLYYPEIHADDPTYNLGNDVAWVLEEAPELTEGDREVLTDLISRVIIDPTGNRQALTDFVYTIAESSE